MGRRRLPIAIKAMRASLRTATEPDLRERLQNALRHLERLYGFPIEPMSQDDGDLKRRQYFVRTQHRLNPVKSRHVAIGEGD